MQLSENEILGFMRENDGVVVESVDFYGDVYSLWMSYCRIGPSSDQDMIVLVPGFGSGWTGMSMLGFFLAKLGYEIVMVSLLSYGNSSDPPGIDEGIIVDDVEKLATFATRVLPERRIHWVGHSMGARTIAELAMKYPELVSSLILLAPAGFEERGQLELAAKFFANGLLHAISFWGNDVWRRIKSILPREKSPFSLDRLRLRIKEWWDICHPRLTDDLARIKHPLLIIWGDKDFVYPRRKSVFERMALGLRVSLPLWHNLTMFGSDRVADEINKFLKDRY